MNSSLSYDFVTIPDIQRMGTEGRGKSVQCIGQLHSIEGSLLYLTDADATIAIDTSLLSYKQLRILPPVSIYKTVPIYVYVGGLIDFSSTDTTMMTTITPPPNDSVESVESVESLHHVNKDDGDNNPTDVNTELRKDNANITATDPLSSSMFPPSSSSLSVPILCLKAYIFRLVDLGINSSSTTTSVSSVTSSSHTSTVLVSNTSTTTGAINTSSSSSSSIVYPELHQLLKDRRQFLQEMISKMIE